MISRLITISLILCITLSCYATEDTVSQNVQSRSGDLLLNDGRWEKWGLTKDEWKTYSELMKGPRGLWSPNMSPISVLGLNAKTEEERSRYAVLAAKQDWQRLMSERAWHLSFKQAMGDVFGKEISLLGLENISIDSLKPSSKLVLFTENRCLKKCRKTLNNVISSGASLDIYFVGDYTSKEITEWAVNQQIPITLVNEQRKITLNQDKGLFKAMSVSDALPQVFIRDQRRDGELMEVIF